jgi:hypothetical protein
MNKRVNTRSEALPLSKSFMWRGLAMSWVSSASCFTNSTRMDRMLIRCIHRATQEILTRKQKIWLCKIAKSALGRNRVAFFTFYTILEQSEWDEPRWSTDCIELAIFVLKYLVVHSLECCNSLFTQASFVSLSGNFKEKEAMNDKQLVSGNLVQSLGEGTIDT